MICLYIFVHIKMNTLLIAESGNSKSKKFLFERIFLAIQPFNVEMLQAFGALFQIPHYYRKFLHCKLKMLFYKKIFFEENYSVIRIRISKQNRTSR
jgi:hypothetical protein